MIHSPPDTPSRLQTFTTRNGIEIPDSGEFLLVGGPADGRRMKMEHPMPEVRVVTAIGSQAFSVAFEGSSWVESRYFPRQFQCGSKRYVIYSWVGMPESEIFERLISSYPESDQRNIP